MTTYREERIRRLAYEIWEREDRPQGRDAEHWRMATEAYEAEMFSSRLDDAGQPMEAGLRPVQERSMDAPTAAPKARRARKPQVATAPRVETTPAPKRKRRTRAEMAAAAASVAGAAAAVVAATVAVTKRRRGAKPEAADGATPATTAAPRRTRRTASRTTLSEPDPAPVGGVTSDGASGAIPDASADGPSDVATGPVPEPGAEPPSEAALETFPESALDPDPSGERVAD